MSTNLVIRKAVLEDVHPLVALAAAAFRDAYRHLDDPADIEEWYVARFLTLRDTAFRDPASYFHRYVNLTDDAAIAESRRIWREINLVNLQANILPTRARATLILHKNADHGVGSVRLRRR